MGLSKHWVIMLVGCVLVLQGIPLPKEESVRNPEENEGLDGGDMVPPPLIVTSSEGRGVAMRSRAARWTGGVVPYEFAANITSTQAAFIESQMREMENLTSVNNTQCISFRQKAVSDPYYITIFNGSGCFAPVGSWGNYIGVRGVSFFNGLYATCMVSGVIQHELTHILGFFHEQSRPDRDSYVSIQWANIDPNQAFNFDKYTDLDVDTQMTSYDYGSVMHYGKNAFALNTSGLTIIPIQNASAFIGQRVQLSPIDILEIQRYYGCVPTPNNSATTTSTLTTSTTSDTTTINASIVNNNSTSIPSTAGTGTIPIVSTTTATSASLDGKTIGIAVGINAGILVLLGMIGGSFAMIRNHYKKKSTLSNESKVNNMKQTANNPQARAPSQPKKPRQTLRTNRAFERPNAV